MKEFNVGDVVVFYSHTEKKELYGDIIEICDIRKEDKVIKYAWVQSVGGYIWAWVPYEELL